jgi:Tfp pilus assembly protein PilN
VEPAHPLSALKIGAIRLSQAQLAEYEPLMTVPIGLALAGEPTKGVRRISLLPQEVAVVREQRRQAALAFAAVAGVGALLLALWASKQSKVSDEKSKANDAEQQASRLEARRTQLKDVTTLQTDLQQRQAQVANALKNDVAWTRLFNDIATVIPTDVWLVSFQGQKATASGTPATPATAAAATLGTVTIQGSGFEQTSTARWLLRVGDLHEFNGLWVSNSTKTGSGANQIVTFQSTANLTDQSFSKRLDRYTGTGQ